MSEFYVIELFKQYGGYSGKPYPYFKTRNGITPNLELARKFKSKETAIKNLTIRKYPTAKLFKVVEGSLIEIKLEDSVL